MNAPSLKHPHLAMVVIGLAELMVTLDNSIVNVALPSAQADFGFDDALRSWIISVYALAFGSLLPLLASIAQYRAAAVSEFGSGAPGLGGFETAMGFAAVFFLLISEFERHALLAKPLLVFTFLAAPAKATIRPSRRTGRMGSSLL